jgi:MFS family permease
MTETGISPAVALPVRGGRASLRRLLVNVGVANAALYALYIGVIQVLLPLQVEHVDRAHKVAVLGLVSGVSAIFAAVFNPVGGALSDRTRSRFGRRAPWLAGASAAVILAVIILGSAGSVLTIIIGWSLAQAVANLYQAALTAVVPDRVPRERRGTASAVVGVATSVGAVAGVGLAGRFADHLPWGYLALGALLALTAIIFVTATTDASSADLPRMPRDSRGLGSRLSDFTAALRHRDFAWVFAGRAGMILGYFVVTGYELYILTDYVRLPGGMRATAGVTILAAVSTLCSILAAALAGPLSDRLQRRKVFVFISAATSGAAMVLPILSPTFTAMLAFAVIAGLAFGTYMAVDVALVTLVLPRREDAARDMGVLNIANAGPQIIAPLFAALVIDHLGGYRALFVAGAVIAVAGAFAIVPVRSVR